MVCDEKMFGTCMLLSHCMSNMFSCATMQTCKITIIVNSVVIKVNKLSTTVLTSPHRTTFIGLDPPLNFKTQITFNSSISASLIFDNRDLRYCLGYLPIVSYLKY